MPTGLEAVAWAREVERLGAGEIVLTSMDADGTKNGYDLEMTARGERGGDDPGRRQRRGGEAGAPGRRDPAGQGRRGPGRQHLPLRRVHDSTRPKRIMAGTGIPVRLRRVRRLHEASRLAMRPFEAAMSTSRQRSNRTARLTWRPADRPTTPSKQLRRQREELEIDKLFRALVKLEGQRLAPEGRPAAASCASTARCGR